MSRGIVIGRFIPPQTGHVAMIRTALAMVDRLTILVCWQPDDVVPVQLRLDWMREMFPDARVIGREAPSPKVSAENPARWAAIVRDVHPERIDQLFTSDRSHAPLAAELRTRFIMIDPDHRAVPAWSNRIRADPWGNWRFLPPAVRHFFARTICLHGPESTGKSTLAPQLAARLRPRVRQQDARRVRRGDEGRGPGVRLRHAGHPRRGDHPQRVRRVVLRADADVISVVLDPDRELLLKR